MQGMSRRKTKMIKRPLTQSNHLMHLIRTWTYSFCFENFINQRTQCTTQNNIEHLQPILQATNSPCSKTHHIPEDAVTQTTNDFKKSSNSIRMGEMIEVDTAF